MNTIDCGWTARIRCNRRKVEIQIKAVGSRSIFYNAHFRTNDIFFYIYKSTHVLLLYCTSRSLTVYFEINFLANVIYCTPG